MLQNTASATHTHANNVPLSHRTCQAPLTEVEAQDNLDTADPDTKASDPDSDGDEDEEVDDVWNVHANQDRHNICYPCVKQTKPVRRQHQVSLTLLRVCRQIHHEAKSVPYAKNTFVFNCSSVMERFIRQRFQYKQHLLIRSIFLDIGMDHPSTQDGWAKAISNSVLKKLTKLRQVHIGLEQIYCMCWVRQCQYKEAGYNDLFVKITKLGRLALKEVTVVISDQHWLADFANMQEFGELENDYRWTLGQKQDFSREMRKVLLAKREE